MIPSAARDCARSSPLQPGREKQDVFGKRGAPREWITTSGHTFRSSSSKRSRRAAMDGTFNSGSIWVAAAAKPATEVRRCARRGGVWASPNWTWHSASVARKLPWTRLILQRTACNLSLPPQSSGQRPSSCRSSTRNSREPSAMNSMVKRSIPRRGIFGKELKGSSTRCHCVVSGTSPARTAMT